MSQVIEHDNISVQLLQNIIQNNEKAAEGITARLMQISETTVPSVTRQLSSDRQELCAELMAGMKSSLSQPAATDFHPSVNDTAAASLRPVRNPIPRSSQSVLWMDNSIDPTGPNRIPRALMASDVGPRKLVDAQDIATRPLTGIGMKLT